MLTLARFREHHMFRSRQMLTSGKGTERNGGVGGSSKSVPSRKLSTHPSLSPPFISQRSQLPRARASTRQQGAAVSRTHRCSSSLSSCCYYYFTCNLPKIKGPRAEFEQFRTVPVEGNTTVLTLSPSSVLGRNFPSAWQQNSGRICERAVACLICADSTLPDNSIKRDLELNEHERGQIP